MRFRKKGMGYNKPKEVIPFLKKAV